MNDAQDSALAAARLSAEFAATAATYDRDATFPFGNFERLASEGLLGLTVATARGGSGAGLRDAASVVGAIARGEPSTALVLAMHYILHATMPRLWPAEIVDRLGRETVAGVSLINALRVEPELGTPARGGLPATTAVREAAGWRLTGHKIYSTGAPILSWYAVWARTDEPQPRVGNFLVPARAPGIRVVESWNHLGMRASGSHDVVLDAVLLPPEAAVDIRPPAGWQPPDPITIAWNTLLVAALYDGVARSARDWLVDFLRDRIPTNLGAPLASQPRFQDAVGGIEAMLAVNARLLRGAAAEVDGGRPPEGAESGLLKMTIADNAIGVVEQALKLTGNPGLSRNNPLERHYRDVLCARIHTPQDDIVRLTAGRVALGV